MKLDPVIKAYALEHKKEFSLFKQAIKRYDRIAIFRHIRPDFDAMGTQVGSVIVISAGVAYLVYLSWIFLSL